MKFQKFNFIKDWKWLVIIPTITIIIDEPRYMEHNFSIQLHWLGFHFRWFWIKEHK